ncbi:MAG TPA: hypothetical protein VNZ22_04795 [Bacillota bacterium]|nr:hypothetical protein [Bacillota bacterium]
MNTLKLPTPLTSARRLSTCAGLVAALSGAAVSQAADILMTAGDGAGQSSFASGLHWPGTLAPSAGNAYFNNNFLLRTATDGNNYTFGGDSLKITSGSALGADLNASLMFKGSAASTTITVNNLTIDGGNLRHGGGDAQTFTLAGNGLTVGNAGMGVHIQGPTFITAPVFGSGEIRILDNGSTSAARTLHFASALNTFNGNINLVTANRSRFSLDSGADLDFTIGASGVNNRVFGSGVANFDGTFNFDLSGASSNPGDSWTIVDVGTVAETFGSTFNVAGFAQNGTLWTSGNYAFDQATGVLTSVPEPAPMALITICGLCLVALRIRK